MSRPPQPSKYRNKNIFLHLFDPNSSPEYDLLYAEPYAACWARCYHLWRMQHRVSPCRTVGDLVNFSNRYRSDTYPVFP